MSLLLVGTFSAVILGLVGLYGVLAYVVRQRSNELGIRLAIGASPTTIMRSVVRDGALLTLIGIAVGVPIAFAFTRSMRVFLFQVSPIDPVIFVVMPALLLFAALLASYVPARRAGQIDPIRVLRGD
jgi:ABC-type antimicrobial peptide transport system permease subunit